MKQLTVFVGLVGILLAGCDSSTSPQPKVPSASDTTARVVISPANGTVDSALVVTLTSATAGATIRYTLDGTLPGDSSPVYSAPLVLRGATVVQTLAQAPGMVTSSVSKAAFPASLRRRLVGVWKGTADAYTIAFLLYPDGLFVQLETPPVVSAATPAYRGIGTWATIDSVLVVRGKRSESSIDAKHWGILPETENTISIDFGLSGDSLGMLSQTYLRSSESFESVYSPDTAAAPAIVSDTGSLLSPTTVTIIAADGLAKIHYTLDGSTPTTSSPVYTAPFEVAITSTVKAISTTLGHLPSRVVASSYRIAPTLLGTWTGLDGAMERTYTFGGDGSYGFLFQDTLTGRGVRATGTWTLDPTSYSFELLKADTSGDGAIWHNVMSKPQRGGTDEIVFSGDTVFLEKGVPFLKTANDPSKTSIVAAPMVSLPEGRYLGKQTVYLTSATPGAVIRYTLDNTIVTDSSSIYKDSIVLRGATGLVAVATKPGMARSYDMVKTYEIVAPDAEYSTLYDARDGRTYPVVKIGSQKWMATNLDFVIDTSWCPDGIDSSCLTYGRLYGLHTALAGAAKVARDAPRGVQGICPDGSHLPSFAEWTTLAQRYGGWDKAGLALQSDASGGTDSTGFSILMAGFRSGENFLGSGSAATFWTASGRNLQFRGRFEFVEIFDDPPSHGYSVRCLLD